MADTSLVFNLVARDRASQAISSAGEKVSTAANVVGAGAAAAMGVGLTAALDVSAANDKLAAQLGVGPKEAAELSKVSASVYQQAWGDSTETVNTAIRGVYQNIGDTSTAEGGLEGVTIKALALAETFDQDVSMATAAVGQMIKTGLAADADEAFDIITAGMQKGVNKSDDFLETLNEYGTQFRDLGLSGQQATGILQQGLQAGARDADLVADSMKELNIRVQSGDAAEGLKALGLNADEMAGAFAKGGPKATNALDEITDRLRAVKDPTERYALAQQLLGTQSEDLSKALFAIDPSKAVDSLGKVEGAADRMAKTVGDNPAAALESFKRKATAELAEVAGGFISFAMDNQQVFKPLAYTLAAVAATILVVKGAMMAYAAGQAVVTAATTVWTGVQWLLNAAFWANPMTWIIVGIIALIAAIVLIATKTTWFQTAWKAMTSAVAAAWSWVWSKIKQIAGFIVNLFMNWTVVGRIIKHWKAIKNRTVAIWNAVLGFVKKLPGRMVSFFLNWTLAGRVIKHFGQAKDGAVRVATRLVDWVKGLPGKIKRGIGSLKDVLYGKGQDLVRGLLNGVKSMGDWLAGELKSFASSVVPGPIASALGIGSPSRVMADVVGRWIPPGVVAGIDETKPELDRAMSTLVDPAAARPAARPAAPLARGGAGMPAHVIVELRGDLLKIFRKEIRVRGGNVQTVLGPGGG
ncbi:phage tail tape measure protein [Streptomyces synnematoformans]|uniref:Phage tail tape measure protein domain-containing protein n=1 Tax=Streptomyces synnematoformans TaxID=415721 RepID=A0ABP5IY89_9ACTN